MRPVVPLARDARRLIAFDSRDLWSRLERPRSERAASMPPVRGAGQTAERDETTLRWSGAGRPAPDPATAGGRFVPLRILQPRTRGCRAHTGPDSAAILAAEPSPVEP